MKSFKPSTCLSVFILFIGIILIVGFTRSAQAKPGDLDLSFGTGGKVTTAVGTVDDVAYALATQTDGRLVAAGYAHIGIQDVFALTRYNTNGSLDTTFGTGGKVTTAIGTVADKAFALVIQPDGKLVAAGYTNSGTAAVPVFKFALVRYNTNGSLDTTFGTGGIVTTVVGSYDAVYGLAIQADGKLVAAGYSFNNVPAAYEFTLVRYNTNGSLDATFGTGGKVTTAIGNYDDTAYALAIQPDGKLVAAGYSYNVVDIEYEFALVRYNTNGTLDSTFNPASLTPGIVTTSIGADEDIATALAIQPDGKLVAAGYSYNVADIEYEFALVRYNTNGTLDMTFGTGGIVSTPIGYYDDKAFALKIQPDRKLVVAGYSYNAAEDWYEFALARYNTNGTLDTTFGTGGIVLTPIGNYDDTAYALAIQPDGKLVAAGYSDSSGNGTQYKFALVRYLGGLTITIPSGASSCVANYNGICAYSPNPLTITSGDSLVWSNADTLSHTATSDDHSDTFALDQPVAPSNSFSTAVISAGTSSAAIGPFINPTGSPQIKLYHCSFHPATMKGTLIINPNISPSADSLTPVNSVTAVGTPQTFTLVLSDPNGWQNIAVANLYLAGGLQNDWVHYLAAPNLFTMLGSNAVCSPGQATTISSGSLTLDCAASSVSGSGTTLTVNFRVTPQPSFGGAVYNLFFAVSDQFGGADAKFGGTWLVNHPPTAVSLTPVNITTAVGTPQTFTLVLSDPNGWQNIAVGDLYLAGGLQNDWLHYLAAPNLFTMLGTNAFCSPGQATTISSGSLTLNCATSSVSGSGNTLTVNFRVTPQPSFAGIPYNLFIAVSDQLGGANAKFAGTWLVTP